MKQNKERPSFLATLMSLILFLFAVTGFLVVNITIGAYTIVVQTVDKVWDFFFGNFLPICRSCGKSMTPEQDCGGDCIYCMADAGDPECVKHFLPSRQELQDMPLEWLRGYYSAMKQADPQEVFNESLRECECDDFTKGWQAACIDRGAKNG